MMKIFLKKISCFILLMIVACIGMFLYACDSNNKVSDNKESVDNTQVTYEWNGIGDFNLKKNYESYQYEEVYVVDNEGSVYDVEIDDSSVIYGTAGEYMVTFSFADETKECKVKIYDIPTLTGPSNIEQSYQNIFDRTAKDGLLSSYEAYDSFGDELSVGIVENASSDILFESSGHLNYGEHNIVLAARDKAGQIILKDVTVSVIEDVNNAPSFLDDEIKIDVTEKEKSLSIDLSGHEVAMVLVNEERVLDYSYNGVDKVLELELDSLESLELNAENKIRVVSKYGYSERSIEYVDENPAVMDVGGKNKITLNKGDIAPIIIPKKVYKKQSFDIELSLKSPSGQSLNVNNQNFVASEMGVYSLVATAKNGGEIRGTVCIDYYVHETYNSLNSNDAIENVFGYKRVYSSTHQSVGSTTKIVNDVELDGVNGTFCEFTFTNSSYLGFRIPTSLTKQEIINLKNAGVENVSVNVFFNGVGTKYLYGTLVVNHKQTGHKERFQPKKWYTITLSIDDIIANYEGLQDGSVLLFNIYNGGDGLDQYEESFKVYFTSMIFSVPLSIPTVSEYSEYNSLSTERHLAGYTYSSKVTIGDTANHDGVSSSYVQNETIGDVTGNFVKVRLGVASNGAAPNRVGANFSVLKTKAEIEALKSAGYYALKVPIYMSCVKSKQFTPMMISNGAGQTSTKVGNQQEFLLGNIWNNLYIPIDDIITNYDAIKEGRVYFGVVENNGWFYPTIDLNEANFDIYYGGLYFVKDVQASAAEYNSFASSKHLEGLTYSHNITNGYNNKTDGLSVKWHQNANLKSVLGNYYEIKVSGTANNGPAASRIGVAFPVFKTKAEIEALKKSGYTALRVPMYISASTYKNVLADIVVQQGEGVTATRVGAAKKLEADTLTNYDIPIDTIITYYEQLAAGTAYLLPIENTGWDGQETNQSNFSIFYGNLYFVK